MTVPFLSRRRPRLKAVTGLWHRGDGAALARISRKSGTPRLLDCRFFEARDFAALVREMGGVVAADRSWRANCVCVMDCQSYDLKQLEPPDVPDAELKEAMRWQVRDLIDYELEDAVIDIFPVPELPYRKEERNFWVVCARTARVQEPLSLMRRLEMKISAVDIPELALRNIAELLPEEPQGVAILHLGLAAGTISLYRGGRLYLTRNIRLKLSELHRNVAESIDFVAQEVQRSLEFYESHFAQPPVAGLYVIPPELPSPQLTPFLRARFGEEVKDLDLRSLLEGPELPANLYGRCLFAIGAALRREAG